MPPKITDRDREVIEQAVIEPRSAVRALILDDLYYFLQYFWSEYSQEPFKPNWHLRYICDELMFVARRVAAGKHKQHDLIINVPPGMTKTATASIMFNLWCWANWWHLKFIAASYSAQLSLESAEYARDIVRSNKWKEVFPELTIKQDKDTKSNFTLVKREFKNKGRNPTEKRGGNRFSTSVGGTVTGFHGHILLIDDPIDPQRAISEAGIKSANHWMDNVLPFRKVDKNVTVTILIMQRLSQDDPTGHLLKTSKPGTVKHICLPGEIKNFKKQLNPPELEKHYVNDLLDPERLDWKALDAILTKGQYTYGGQVGQNPVPLGGGMFKTDHLQIVEHINQSDIIQTVRYWDKAGSQGTGAYTVGVKMARTKDNKFIVLDVKRGQWSSEQRERIIKETADADGVGSKINIGKGVTVWIEQEPGSGGKESAEATIRNLAGHVVKSERPTGDKVYRADPFSVQVNSGNVRLLNSRWNQDFIDELTNFPNGLYKDQVDAASGAFSKLLGPKRVRVARR